jgi:hypothetical protein
MTQTGMADALKRDGMDRAEEHANSHWWQCMLESAQAVAERKPFFTTDDVVALRRVRHPNATTHEARAIGPLMRQAAKLGYCEQTQDWVESTQPQCHRRPMRVWYSLIYRGPAPLPRPRRRRIIDPRQIKMFAEVA